jgi:hypothetical protein
MAEFSNHCDKPLCTVRTEALIICKNRTVNLYQLNVETISREHVTGGLSGKSFFLCVMILLKFSVFITTKFIVILHVLNVSTGIRNGGLLQFELSTCER